MSGQRLSGWILCGVVCTTVAACAQVASYVDHTANKVHGNIDKQATASPPLELQDFTDSLFIADLHGDSSLWDRDMLRDHCPPGAAGDECHGHLDLPRLVRSNTALQVFTMPTITPICELGYGAQRSQDCTEGPDLAPWLFLFQGKPFTSAPDRAAIQLRRIEDWVEASRTKAGSKPALPRLEVLLTAQDLAQLVETWRRRGVSERHMTGIVIGMEGLHGLGPPSDAVATLESSMRPLRLAGLTHRFSNDYGESSEGVATSPALSPAGRAVLDTLRQRGIVIDVAHASSCLIEAVTAYLGPGKPVIVSHGGYGGAAIGTCGDGKKEGRNLSRQALYQVLETDGVIGVGFWPQAACDPEVLRRLQPRIPVKYAAKPKDCAKPDGRDLLVEAIVETFLFLWEDIEAFCLSSDGDRLAARTGRACDPSEHLAFGSDYDGAVTVPFDSTHRTELIAHLRNRLPGSAQSDRDRHIRKIAGWNACRVLATALPDGDATRAMHLCAPILEATARVR